MVTFEKIIFTNKETGKSTYLLNRIIGLEQNEYITEDTAAWISWNQKRTDTNLWETHRECHLQYISSELEDSIFQSTYMGIIKNSSQKT